MSAFKSGSSLRNLVLTPNRIPDFLIPSRSPLRLLSPRLQGSSPDRTRLLSDPEDDSSGSTPPVTPLSPAASRRFLRLPHIRRPRRAAAVAAESVDADTDLTTQAALSLPHVPKVTTPYGFRAVLAASPCTRRRESLFHHRPVMVAVTESDPQDSTPGPSPGRTRVCLRPEKTLGLQVMKELKRPAAALKALSPAFRRTHPC